MALMITYDFKGCSYLTLMTYDFPGIKPCSRSICEEKRELPEMPLAKLPDV